MTKASVVVPGEKVGVAEEFMPGTGTYEHAGTVYSKLLGQLKVDLESRVASVNPPEGKVANIPAVRDIVVAQVTDARRDVATTSIVCIEGRKELSVPCTGQLHISRVSRSFFNSIEDAMRIGDILRGAVVSVEPHLRLSVNGRDLGVIAAFCSICGQMLKLATNRLICANCENVERRKISSRYINVGQPDPRGEKTENNNRES